MTQRVQHDAFDWRFGFTPQVITDNTAAVSAIIDTQGYSSCAFAIITGTLADADATFTILVEDGADSGLSDAAAVADTFLDPTEATASFTFADDSKVRLISYKGPKRYVRLTCTPANNSGNAPLACLVALGRPHEAPTTTNA